MHHFLMGHEHTFMTKYKREGNLDSCKHFRNFGSLFFTLHANAVACLYVCHLKTLLTNLTGKISHLNTTFPQKFQWSWQFQQENKNSVVGRILAAFISAMWCLMWRQDLLVELWKAARHGPQAAGGFSSTSGGPSPGALQWEAFASRLISGWTGCSLLHERYKHWTNSQEGWIYSVSVIIGWEARICLVLHKKQHQTGWLLHFGPFSSGLNLESCEIRAMSNADQCPEPLQVG